MSWIESHQSLLSHRKTLRAATLLKADRYKLIGHLHALWWWGLDSADTDGRIAGIGDSEIAAAAGWPEKKGPEFVSALITAGFIDDREGEYWLHDWFDYAGKLNGQVELRRESNRAAQAARRQRLREQKNADCIDDSQQESALTADDSQHSTQPTVPYLPNLPEGSIDPSPPEKAEKPIPLAKKTNPTPSWKEQMRAKYGTRVGDFDRRWNFHTNSKYYANKPDKCQFLEDAFDDDVKWQEEHPPASRNPNSRGPTMVRDARAEAIAAGFNVDD